MKNRFLFLLTSLLVVLLAIAGCGRDPEKVKQRYLENGNKYLSQGKYKEAVIMYKNAIKKDPKFGEAYAKLGDAEIARGELRNAVSAYRRAIELMPKSEDSAGKLADIYLAAYAYQKKKEDTRLLDEVADLAKTLLTRDPKSYHGLRLSGFLAVSKKEPDYAKATEFFREANRTRPKQPELLFALCQVLSQDHQWAEAETIAKQLLQDSPNYLPTYDFLSIEYLRRSQPQAAEAVLAKKVAQFPKVVEFRLAQALFYRAIQNKEMSDKVLNDIMAREQDFPDARRKVGDFLLRVRENDRATKLYQEGEAKNDAHRTEYRLRLAQILLAQGKQAEAMAMVETALKDDPKSNEALGLRASMQLQYGGKDKQQGAIADLQSLLGRSPQNVVVRFNLARAFQIRGELEPARVQFQEAVKIQPSFVAAQVGLAQVYLLQREYGKALSTAEDALKLDPKNVQARVAKSNALLNSGNIRQARSDVTDFLKENPESPELQFQMALVEFIDNNMKESEALMRKLHAKYPTDLRVTYAIVEILLRTNRQQDALNLVREEAQKMPDNRSLQLSVANVALRIDQPEAAEQEYRKILEKDPKNPELYLRIAETLRRRGQAQASLDMARKGQQLAPTSPSANLQVAMMMEAVGDHKGSIPHYENVLKVDPDNFYALNNLAFLYADSGKDLDQALTYVQRAKAKVPNNDDISDTLGFVYVKKNLNDQAITIFRELTSKQPKNPTYHYHLGMAQFQKGNKPAARQSLQTALTLKPGKDDEAKIRELLGKVG
jgi:putative PEP-CTERM system TPR-repeat lipoprotein